MVSIQRIAELLREIFLRCCGENASFFKKKKERKEEREGGKGSCTVNLVSGKKTQSWLGIWELADGNTAFLVKGNI